MTANAVNHLGVQDSVKSVWILFLGVTDIHDENDLDFGVITYITCAELHRNPGEQVGDWLAFNLLCCCDQCPKVPMAG
jgi:hypothetical protein